MRTLALLTTLALLAGALTVVADAPSAPASDLVRTAGAGADDAATIVEQPGSIAPRVHAGTDDAPARGRNAAPARRSSHGTALSGIDADWNNFGGNAQRNGRTGVPGPDADELLWANADDFSIIAWHPVTFGSRVFAIRESGFPGTVANDALVAYDLETGAELWRVTVPYGGDPDEEWIAYVAGAHGGRVYAARGGSGRTTPVHAFDVEDGALLWSSAHETVAGPQDGVVFAPDGDLIVGDFDHIARIDAADGSTVWVTPRSCPVSGNCGCAINGDGVFIDEAAPGGNVVAKHDLETGAFLYETVVLPGFTSQNAPFVSADGGTVYFARSQNNPATDFLYAFTDTGTALEQQWATPVRWTTSHEHGLAADGSIYTFLPGDELVRLDPATGAVTASAGVLGPIGTNLSPRTAVGSNGHVYVSNGWANDPATNGRIWAFTADLGTNLFTLTLNRQNSGGPSLGADGTLVVADRVSVRAYRTEMACPGDLDGSGAVGVEDLLIVLGDWGCAGTCAGDADGDGMVAVGDLLVVLGAWGECG